MKFLTILTALIISATALGPTQVPNVFQSGQPALAGDVNENFSELEAGVNQNTGDIAVNTTAIQALSDSLAGLNLDASFSDIDGRMLKLEGNMGLVLNQVTTCNNYQLYGCTQSTSGNSTVFEILQKEYRIDGGRFRPPGGAANTHFLAIPTTPSNYSDLWIGGTANLTRTIIFSYTEVLVDDCDNPTIHLVLVGEGPSSRLVTNNGNFCMANSDPIGGGLGPILNTVDVTGQQYGVINTQTTGNVIEACTLVTDRVGMYDTYGITLQFNTNDGRFNSPWVHQ